MSITKQEFDQNYVDGVQTGVGCTLVSLILLALAFAFGRGTAPTVDVTYVIHGGAHVHCIPSGR